ncbi:hypothetical protein [Microbacterium sp.]|uniref:hypothetical protein n=1 Tax=Microbacterium sp. TaxID=51671 RepID=UPI003A928A1E
MDDLFANIEDRLNSGMATERRSLAPSADHKDGGADAERINPDGHDIGSGAEPVYSGQEELSEAEQEAEVEPQDHDVSPLSVDSLTKLILRRFPAQGAGDAGEIDQIASHLLEMGIDTIGSIESRLSDIDSDNVARLMGYVAETSGARRMDDELLAALEDDYVTNVRDSERRQLLSARLRRVRGKFSIYQLRNATSETKLLTASLTVRYLAALVATRKGISGAIIPGVIAESLDELNPSTRPRIIRTKAGSLCVATNLSRAAAEDIMRQLASRLPRGLKVIRGGDVVFESGRPE